MTHEPRSIDRWLKWAAIIGPVTGFIFGNCSGAVIAYQAFKNDSERIFHLENWKEKQDDFDRTVVSSISRLKALVRDNQP